MLLVDCGGTRSSGNRLRGGRGNSDRKVDCGRGPELSGSKVVSKCEQLGGML
jgi:hypothetical protein